MEQFKIQKSDSGEALNVRGFMLNVVPRWNPKQQDLLERAVEELDEAKRSVNTGLLLKIFSVLDDFQRAIDLVPNEAISPGWLEGIHLVYKKIETMIDSEGVSKIEAVGKIFNPRECEAVVYEESSSAPEGEVTKKIQQEQKPDESEESN